MERYGIVLVIVVFILSAGTVQAQGNSDQAAANAGAEIVDGLSIINNQGLDFGQVVSPNSGSINVTVSTEGTRSSSGTGDLLVGSGGHAATFDIITPGNSSWQVELPTSIELSGNSEDKFTVSNFSVDSPSGSGDATIKVGATVEIESADAAESYSGTFDVTVSHQ